MSKEKAETTEFSDDKLKVRVTRSPGCKVLMEVEVSPSACTDLYEAAAKWVRKQVSIPGFRKGKVPLDRVKRQFATAVESEWRDRVVSSVFGDALHLAKVYPWKREEAAIPKLGSLSLEEGGRVSYTYEAQPEIRSFSRDSLDLEIPEAKEISEEEIDEGVEELRKLWPEFKEITVRPAQIGDTVHIDVDHIGGDSPETVFENRAVELKEENQDDWIHKILIGSEVGATIDGNPDETSQEANYRVTLRSISERLPATDEVLLERTQAKDMDELRQNVRRDKERSEQRRIRGELADAVWTKLYETLPIELPQSLLEGETKDRIRQRVNALRSENKSDEEITALDQQIREEAEEQVSRQFHKLFFALHIADEANCRPTDEAVRTRVNLLLQLSSMSGKELPSKHEYAAMTNKVYLDLIAERAEEWLLEPLLPSAGS